MLQLSSRQTYLILTFGHIQLQSGCLIKPPRVLIECAVVVLTDNFFLMVNLTK